MPAMTLIGMLSSAGKLISAVWTNGSRFLWSLSLAALAVAFVLWVGAIYKIPQAEPWWNDYGLLSLVASAVLAVLAAFKMAAERANAKRLYLIAEEEQSLWHHAKQGNGSIQTQFSLKFSATNRNGHTLNLLKARIRRPRLWGKAAVQSIVSTEDPAINRYSKNHSLPPRSRRLCHAHLMIEGELGGSNRTKPMDVRLEVQDNLGQWHSLDFIGLRDPQFGR